jgi:hypothetical protein
MDAAKHIGHSASLRQSGPESGHDFVERGKMAALWEIAKFVKFRQRHISFPRDRLNSICDYSSSIKPWQDSL